MCVALPAPAIINDKSMSLEDYNSNTRNQIRKGLKMCKVIKITKEELVDFGYDVYLEAFKNSSEIVCKISLPITKTSEFLDKFSNDIKYFIDWAGGLIWISARDNEIISKMRIFTVKNNGHLTIYKAEANFRRTEEFLTYGDTNLKVLSSKIKKSFDPNLILNPGKMYAGI